MKQTIRSFVGMDVHKATISISVAEDGPRGPVPHTIGIREHHPLRMQGLTPLRRTIDKRHGRGVSVPEHPLRFGPDTSVTSPLPC
jgi:hypothetical protein